jgi:hypothetical protein
MAVGEAVRVDFPARRRDMRIKATIPIFLAALLPCAALGVPTAVINFTKPLPGTTAASDPSLAGPVLSDKIIAYSTPPGAALPAKGTVQVRVVRGADGRLNFYWRIIAAAGSKDVVQALEIHRFPRRVYDANWRIDGLGTVAPALVGGTVLPGPSWRMHFLFRRGIGAGQQSRFFFLRGRTLGTQPAAIRVRFGSSQSAMLPAVGPR